ncbi:MAG: metal-dependent hydrolase [bacterium]
MSLIIKFIGHSAFVINYGANSIIIDPFITGNSQAKFDPVDLNVRDILITHAHGDHLGDSIEIAKKKSATITAMFEIANYCAKKGVKTQGVNMGGKVPFSWGNAYWLPAAHSSSMPDGQYGGEAAGILLNIGGTSVFHAGDTGLHLNFKMIGEFYKPEISILPIGGYYTMGIDEAVQAAKWLGSKKIIPMHYNTFPQIQIDVKEFKKRIESEASAECIILNPGEIYKI